MQAVLVMFRSDGERRSFSIARDMTVVGRREDCDLRIPLGDVSRKHCRLVRDGDSLRLEDLGSSNGTYLNGRRIQEAALTAGDSIQIGPVVFVLQIDGHPADDDLHPVSADNLSQGSSAGALAMPGGDEMVALNPTAQSDLDMLEPIEDESGQGSGVGEGPGAARRPAPEPLDALEPLGGGNGPGGPMLGSDEAFDLVTDEPAQQSGAGEQVDFNLDSDEPKR